MTRYRGYKAFGTRFVLPAAAIVAAMYPSACATATTPRCRTDHHPRAGELRGRGNGRHESRLHGGVDLLRRRGPLTVTIERMGE